MSPVIAAVPRTVGDLEIQEWMHRRYGYVPHPFWITHCRELYLQEDPQQDGRAPWHECPPEKRPEIKEAFRHFGILQDQD